MPIALAGVKCLTVAAKLTPQHAALMAAVVAMTAAVAVSLNGQPFPVACFAVLVCLMVAPANMFEVGLLSAVPPMAGVFLASRDSEITATVQRLLATLVGGIGPAP